MRSYYDYYNPQFPSEFYYGFDPILSTLGVVFFIIGLAIAAISVIAYCLECVAYYRIIKNRGYQNPWLIWIPFARTYLKCALADDILIKTGKSPFLGRVSLILLSILLPFSLFTVGIFFFGGNVRAIATLFVLVILLASLALTVIRFAAYYFFLEDYQNNYAILFFVLTLFFSLTEPVVAMISKNKQPRSMGGIG